MLIRNKQKDKTMAKREETIRTKYVNARAEVCKDIVLKAISNGSLNRNII